MSNEFVNEMSLLINQHLVISPSVRQEFNQGMFDTDSKEW